MQLDEEGFFYENKNNNKFINEITKRVNVMKQSKYRTTNFSLIEYFVNNDFQPLNKNFLILHLMIDFNADPKRYVLAKKNEMFKSEKSFRQSVLHHIRKNDSFREGPGKDQLSLNFENTCIYLRSVYSKYINNSRNVNTPIKICSKNNIFRKKNPSLMNNIKREKVMDDDNFDFDIEIINEKKRSFSQMEKRNDIIKNKNNKYIDKYEETPKEDELNNSIITLSDFDDSQPRKSDKYNPLKDKEKIFPEIFSKTLIKKNHIISSLNKTSILEIQNLIKDYIKHITGEEYSEIIEDKLKNINKSLKEINEFKIAYDKERNILNILQGEIFKIWRSMIFQLKAVKKGINIDVYNYTIYANLRDLLFKSEKIYKDILSKIKISLNEITDLERQSQDKIKIIKNDLSSIKDDLIDDKDFCEIFGLIADLLWIDFGKYNHSDEDENQEEEEEENSNYLFCGDVISEKIRSFHEERRKIIDDIKQIDKNIGNITVY